MSTDLTTKPLTDLDAFQTPENLAAYMADLRQTSSEDDNASADVDINRLIPYIKFNNAGSTYGVMIGDETMANVAEMFVTVVDIKGSKACWLPEGHPAKEVSKLPLCSTGLVDNVLLRAGGGAKGIWTINEFFGQPYAKAVKDAEGNSIPYAMGDAVEFECDRCPYNNFGSAKLLDPNKTGNAKACKDSRTLFIRPMDELAGAPAVKDARGVRLAFYSLDEKYARTPLRLPLPFASHRESLISMNEIAAARQIPVTACVFKLTVKIEKEGNLAWPVSIWTFAGVAGPSALLTIRGHDREWVANFVAKNKRALAASEDLPF